MTEGDNRMAESIVGKAIRAYAPSKMPTTVPRVAVAPRGMVNM